MKAVVSGYIYHKQNELYSDCVDRYGFNIQTNKFAISDGVSNSFFPGIWAEMLISEFVGKEGEVDGTGTDDLRGIQDKWFGKVKEIAENSPKWVLRKNFNDRRPALATFVGLHFIKKNGKFRWAALALGDSFLFFVPKKWQEFSLTDKGSKFLCLSSKDDFVFDNYPDYFSSIGSNKGTIKTRAGKVEPGTFLLMTDALSEWFIKEKEQAFETIRGWRSHEDYIASIDSLYAENRLHNDDCAILIINVSDDSNQVMNYEFGVVDNITKLIKSENKTIQAPIEPAPLQNPVVTIDQTALVKRPDETVYSQSTEQSPPVESETVNDELQNKEGTFPAEVIVVNEHTPAEESSPVKVSPLNGGDAKQEQQTDEESPLVTGILSKIENNIDEPQTGETSSPVDEILSRMEDGNVKEAPPETMINVAGDSGEFVPQVINSPVQKDGDAADERELTADEVPVTKEKNIFRKAVDGLANKFHSIFPHQDDQSEEEEITGGSEPPEPESLTINDDSAQETNSNQPEEVKPAAAPIEKKGSDGKKKGGPSSSIINKF